MKPDNRIGPVRMRVPEDQLTRWKDLHRQSYPEHGLTFAMWLRAIIDQYVSKFQED